MCLPMLWVEICDILPGLWVMSYKVCRGYESAVLKFFIVVGKCCQFIAITIRYDINCLKKEI